MRGQWDNEQPLSPILLRSAMAVVGGFLALSAIVMLVISVTSAIAGFYVVAAIQFAVGIALPFSIWLAIKILADIVTVLNRTHDRLEAIEEHFTGITPLRPQASAYANGPAAGRASDDGPVYPSED